MNIIETLAYSWRIFWKHKILWLFGCMNLSVAPFAAIGILLLVLSLGLVSFEPGVFSPEDLSPTQVGIFIFLGIIIVVMLLAIFVLAAFCTACIIKGAWQVEEGREHLHFSELFHQAGAIIWRVILGQAIFTCISLSFWLLAFLPLFLIDTNSPAWILACMLGIGVYFFLTIAFNLYFLMFYPMLIGDDTRLSAIWGRLWSFFKKNIGMLIVIALILYATSVIVNMVLSPLSMCISLPLTLLAGSEQSGGSTLFIVCFGLLLFFIITVSLVVVTLLSTFGNIFTTISYRRLTGRSQVQLPAQENPIPPLPAEPS